jgi:hypothetical protein
MQRTPPPAQKNISDFFSPMVNNSRMSKPTKVPEPNDPTNHKRSRTDLLNSDFDTESTCGDMNENNLKAILEAVNGSKTELSGKIDEIQKTVSEKIDSATAKIDGLSNKLDVVTADVESVSLTVTQHVRDINFLNRRVNDLEQSKLEKHMEIAGIEKTVAEQNKNNLISFAHQLISSFKIALSKDKIGDAYLRTVEKANLTLLIVIFKDVSDKDMVMKWLADNQKG